MKASIEINRANFHLIVPDPQGLSGKKCETLAHGTQIFLDMLSQK